MVTGIRNLFRAPADTRAMWLYASLLAYRIPAVLLADDLAALLAGSRPAASA